MKEYSVHNSNDAEVLLKGFLEGFRLAYTGPRISCFSTNLISADIHKDETKSKLLKEVELGRVLGPFSEKPISTLRVSPIGLVPKNSGGWRLITHLSYPSQGSVNDFIDPDVATVKYSSFDKVVEMVSKLGRSALCGKMDISQAFRLLLVHPGDFDLLGIYFDGFYYIDKCMPMGCSLSCAMFEKFATFLHKIVVNRSGLDTIDHYLDDFFFAGEKGSENCEILMESFRKLCSQLGVPLAEDKTIGPVTLITFLGLEIDTVLMLVKIPQDKLQKLKDQLIPLMSKKRIAIKELESLTGLMAFCSRAIVSSRAFIRRFYDLIASVKNAKPYYTVRINNEVKSDAEMWLQFLSNFNGECYMPEKFWTSNQSIELFTDSTGNESLGCAAYFRGHWVQYQWPKQWSNTDILADITCLELIPIILAFFIWGSEFSKKKILLHIDNQALVSIINKRTSKSKRVMTLVRILVYLTMQKNIQFKAKHIAGVHNEIADALSRFQSCRFRTLAPNADQSPALVPQEFLQIISKLQ